MPNSFFQFKQFIIHQDKCAMKVTTDACLFGSLLPHFNEHKNVLDIGTGTGLLALMYAQKNPTHSIDAVEINAEAAMQAKENIAASHWHNNIQVYHTDIKHFDPEKKYDVIFSNPPFYENELKGENNVKNIAHHHDGLLLSELFSIIEKKLADNGKFYLLLPFKRYEETKKICRLAGLSIKKIVLVKQSFQHSYFRIVINGEKGTNKNFEEQELAICKSENIYTDDFTNLLKDYYLHL